MRSSVALCALALFGLLSVQQGECRKGSVPDVGTNWPGWRYHLRDIRYNYWLAHIQHHMLPNFTAKGYEVIEAPKPLYKKLLDNFLAKRHTAETEPAVNVVKPGEVPSTFIHQQTLNDEVMRELLPLHEQWANTKLEPMAAFGLRIYHQGNELAWHVDRVDTHIISCIFHIARDVDEPWPIYIEDHNGVMAQVDLQPGQMLFYESARLNHGRPTPLKGRFYTSVFIHYRPLGWSYTTRDVQDWLPHDWDRGTTHDPEEAARRDRLQRLTHDDL